MTDPLVTAPETPARRKRILSFIAVLLIVLIMTFPSLLPLPAKGLLQPDRLKKADGIVVLQGESFYRFQKAVELVKQGYASEILLTPLHEREEELRDFYFFENRVYGMPELSPKEFDIKAFAYFGKTADGIHFTDAKPSSTFDEALATKKWVIEKGWKSFLLVSSTYHMTRAMMIFKLVFRGTGVEIYPVTAKSGIYAPEVWWQKERDVKRVVEEYVSMVFNFVYHFVLGKHNTSFDTF